MKKLRQRGFFLEKIGLSRCIFTLNLIKYFIITWIKNNEGIYERKRNVKNQCKGTS